MESRFNKPLADGVSSFSLSQVSYLLQINFTHRRFFASKLSNLYLQFLFQLAPYRCIFEVNFTNSFLVLIRSKIKQSNVVKQKSRPFAGQKNSRLPLKDLRRRQSSPLKLNRLHTQFFIHQPFLKFRQLFKQNRIPLFNPTIRVRRRKYALFQEKIPFLKKRKVNWPRRRWNRQTVKLQSRHFSRVKRLWFKVLLRKFNFWKKMRLLKRRAKLKVPTTVSSAEVRRYVSKFFRHTLKQAPILSHFSLSGQVSTTEFQTLKKTNLHLASHVTSLFLRFITEWLFKRKSKLSWSTRADFIQLSKKPRYTHSFTSTPQFNLPEQFNYTKLRLPDTKVCQNLHLNSTPNIQLTTKTSFIFRRYLTHLLQDALPTSITRTFRSVRPARFVRRKRPRLPRPLHFVKPYRSKRASFRSSSTFRYLFRRVVLLKRRVSRRKKSFARLQKFGRRGTSTQRFLNRNCQRSLIRKVFVRQKSYTRSLVLTKVTKPLEKLSLTPTLFWIPDNQLNVSKTYNTKPLRSTRLQKLYKRRARVSKLFRVFQKAGKPFTLASKKLSTSKRTSAKHRHGLQVRSFPHSFKHYYHALLNFSHNAKYGFPRRRRRRFSGYRLRNYKFFLRKGRTFSKLNTKVLKGKYLLPLRRVVKEETSRLYPSPFNRFISITKTVNNIDYQGGYRRTINLLYSVKGFKSQKLATPARRPATLTQRRQVAFESLRNLPFILSSTGFLYNPGFIKQVSLKSSSYIRCTKYSFFNALRIKRFILKERKRRFFFAKRRTKRLIRKSVPYARSLAYSRQDNIFSMNLEQSTPYFGDFLSLNVNWTLSQPWEYTPGILRNEYNLRIRRIRFKPGYSRIWRQARTALMQVLDLKFRYQHRLTVYLGRFAHIASRVHKKLLDIRVHTLLIRSRFTFDLTTANSLVTSRLVFVNGQAVLNPRMLLFVGDVLQLIIHLKFYIVYRWLLNWYIFKTHRRARLARSKFKKVSHAQTKQRSSRLPDWLLKARSVNRDIPKFLEVDFFTLSSFIVYTPFSKNDLDVLDLLDSRLEVYNMYNWKYIN